MTLAFALGALVLSVTLATMAYQLSRAYLLRQREAAVLGQTFVNAAVVREKCQNLKSCPTLILPLLDKGSRAVLFQADRVSASALGVVPEQIPPRLLRTVLRGTPARQRFSEKGRPRLAVGVPIPAAGASYFELAPLDELQRTLNVLRGSLIAAALMTSISGAALGRWGSRGVLNPVAAVAAAATSVAGGRLDTRVDVGSDPDLATVATAFNQMTSALQERIQRDARFASSVSHELRSPLTTLAASLEVLLARRDDIPERPRAALDLLAAEVHRFERLVQDLLEISRMDAGVGVLAAEDVRLAEFVVHALRASHIDRYVIDLDPAASAEVVYADKRRLERVVANLVENAENYGGGVVRVGLERVEGALRLAVEDAGPGVAFEERDRIFERFVRGRAAARRGSGEGTGLGLSLVAEHVRLHGGKVWVEDRRGGGARFVVELPLVAP